MLFITLMTKMSDTAEVKYKYDKNSPKLSRAPQGRRLGDETPRSSRSPGSAERTPSRRQELSSSRVSKRKKQRRGKSEYTTCTQQV